MSGGVKEEYNSEGDGGSEHNIEEKFTCKCARTWKFPSQLREGKDRQHTL